MTIPIQLIFDGRLRPMRDQPLSVDRGVPVRRLNLQKRPSSVLMT